MLFSLVTGGTVIHQNSGLIYLHELNSRFAEQLFNSYLVNSQDISDLTITLVLGTFPKCGLTVCLICNVYCRGHCEALPYSME